MPNRVLIADSDLLLLHRYREALWRHGFEVATATDAVECVRQLKSWRPDVLVLDPTLPMGGGIGVLACMHEEEDVPVVPVILLTSGLKSYSEDMVMVLVLTFPIADHHVKSAKPELLVEWVEEVLSRRGRPTERIPAAV
ncbi:MAG: response regulator [Planctomycetes bacterium]|nr:response regulator [Planctomycetota bacterium]